LISHYKTRIKHEFLELKKIFRFVEMLLEKTVKLYGLDWTNHELEEIILHGLDPSSNSWQKIIFVAQNIILQ
jgi:hypothetical protein